VLKAKTNGAVLIPFEYNAEQSFALEFGPAYIRFHTQGATLLEAPKAIAGVSNANPGVFGIPAHGFNNGDWLYLQGLGGMAALNGRWGIVTAATAGNFQLTDLFGNPIDTSAMGAFTGGGTASRVYEIASPYLAADLFDLHYVQSADVLTIVHQNYTVRELRRLGATNWTLTAPTFAPSIDPPVVDPVATESNAGTLSYTYVSTAIKVGTLEESQASGDSNVCTNDLSIAGHGNDIAIGTGRADILRYNFYKSKNGLYGFIGQNFGSMHDDNIEPDLSRRRRSTTPRSPPRTRVP
jgi:hypothetical protein